MRTKSASISAQTWAYLKQIGAEETPHELYLFRVQTQRGPLRVHPHENWIACRFEDVAQGVLEGANPYSGKWNFHGPAAFQNFVFHLEEIL